MKLYLQRLYYCFVVKCKILIIYIIRIDHFWMTKEGGLQLT